MRILLVYPDLYRAKIPQLGIAMISAVAKGLGHQVKLFDFTKVLDGQEVTAFHSKLTSFKPDVLGVSIRSNEWTFAKELFNLINLENTITIFGGPHATVSPEEVISIADIVVLGEGEETFSELLKKIEKKEDFTKVAGCWVRKDGKIFKNEMRELISDLDTLPYPDWDIFNDMYFTRVDSTHILKNVGVVGTFEASRGCVFNCTYCTNGYMKMLFKGKGVWRREKSPERVIKEMQIFKEKYGLDAVSFVDEIFLTKTDKVRKFRDLYLSEINVPFAFMERPENMTEEKVKLISDAGVAMISIGIESGDEELRRTVLNRYHTQDRIISAFHTAKKYGIKTHAFTMIGIPGQDIESINKTYQMVKEVQPTTVQTSVFYPLKRTRLFDMLVQQGKFDPKESMTRGYFETDDIDMIKHQFLITNYYLPRFMLHMLFFARRRRITKRLFDFFLHLVVYYRYWGILSTVRYFFTVGIRKVRKIIQKRYREKIMKGLKKLSQS